MACEFCGHPKVNPHTCNAYCDKSVHYELVYASEMINDFDEALRHFNNSEPIACCEATQNIVYQSIRPAPEAPPLREKMPPSSKAIHDKDYPYAYLATFRYGKVPA